MSSLLHITEAGDDHCSIRTNKEPIHSKNSNLHELRKAKIETVFRLYVVVVMRPKF